MSGTNRNNENSGTTSIAGRTDGKVIDKWTYGDDHCKDKLVFDVLLNHKLKLIVRCSGIPDGRFTSMEGTDIADLKTKVDQIAGREFDFRAGITWSDCLEVVVTGAGSDGKTGGTFNRAPLDGGLLKVSYHALQIGVDANGRRYTVSNGKIRRFEGERDRTGELVTPKDVPAVATGGDVDNSWHLSQQMKAMDMGEHRGYQVSHIPDTPENRKYLDDLMEDVRRIGERIRNALMSANIGNKENPLVGLMEVGGAPDATSGKTKRQP